MKSHLTLHDISAYVFTGMFSSEFKNYNVHGFPLGGVKYFLKYLVLNISNMHDIAVMFDSRSFRKDLYPGYKKGREGNPAVYAQLEFLYDNLRKCNIPCYKAEGFEADDLIFSAVEQNRSEYNRITLHSGDYDITHNVDFQVFFEAVNSNVNNVSYMNFNHSVVRGKEIMQNTISAYKALCGDGSDKFSAFKSERGISGSSLYAEFCQYLRENLNPYDVTVSRTPQALGIFLNSVSARLTPADIKDLLLRIELAFPKKVEGIKFEAGNKNSINIDKFARLLSICNDFPGLKQIKHDKVHLTEEEIETFKRKARELRTGEYAVDRGLPVASREEVQSEALYMREF